MPGEMRIVILTLRLPERHSGRGRARRTQCEGEVETLAADSDVDVVNDEECDGKNLRDDRFERAQREPHGIAHRARWDQLDERHRNENDTAGDQHEDQGGQR